MPRTISSWKVPTPAVAAPGLELDRDRERYRGTSRAAAAVASGGVVTGEVLGLERSSYGKLVAPASSDHMGKQ